MFAKIHKAKNAKRLVIFVLILGIISGMVYLSPSAKSRVKPYYSGDAIVYGNNVYIGTTNTGAFELFSENNGKLYKITSLLSQDFGKKDYFDVLFNTENGKLFAYLVNGNLQKYDLSNPDFPVQTLNIKDNSGDYYYGLTKKGDKIATIGKRGVRVWNYNYEVSEEYTGNFKNNKNAIFSSQGDLLFADDGSELKIFDTASNQLKNAIGFYSRSNHNRAMYNDQNQSAIYLVDDGSLKKYYFSGAYSEFKHTSDSGYDVQALADSPYLYFTDGIGIVKMTKDDLKPIAWNYTTSIGENGWATGLKILSKDGEKAVVFNGSNIVLLNSNLQVISTVNATEKDYSPIEDLYLRLDKSWGCPGERIIMNGGGFAPFEKVIIKFARDKYSVETDGNGKFTANLVVPPLLPLRLDIKAVGDISKLTYSTTFDIN